MTARLALLSGLLLTSALRLVLDDNSLFFIRPLDHEGQLTGTFISEPEMSLPGHHVPLESNETFFDALFVNGSRGYVADPTLFRLQFLSTKTTYFDMLEHYQEQLRPDNVSLSAESICELAPGMDTDIFNSGGFRLLHDKITVSHEPYDEAPSSPKIMCAIYTHDGKRDLARVAALSYGWKCDGFLAFSDVTIPSLGMVGLLHRGNETYMNMIQKSRALWGYMASHYLHQFDYFHLGGDDMHVIVENLRRLVIQMEPRSAAGEPLLLGQVLNKRGKGVVGGGPGYTMNREALKRFAEFLPRCYPNLEMYFEDKAISWCLHDIGIIPTDTREPQTGQQLYHNLTPDRLFNLKAGARAYDSLCKTYFESLPHPKYPNVTVGPTDGMDAVARYSVSFHYLRYPVWMARHHAILYDACPPETPLGKLMHAGRPVA